MLEFFPQHSLSLGGPSVETNSPDPIGARTLKGNLEDTQWKSPQCCPCRIVGRCLVLDITRKQTVPGPSLSFELIWDLVGAQGSQGRERESAAHPHTWQVVDCWLWFSWKDLKQLSEHSLLGPYILWQGCHDPKGVASNPHPLGCFVGCSAEWHRDPGLRDLFSSQPITQEMFGCFLFILEMKTSLKSSTVKRLLLNFDKLFFRVLTPAKISPQAPKAKNKRQPPMFSSMIQPPRSDRDHYPIP